MKPVIKSHLDYRRFLNGIGDQYRILWRSKPPAIREIYIRFRELDLSAVDHIMQDQYSSHGPEPRPPSCMLRSLLLMIVMQDPRGFWNGGHWDSYDDDFADALWG